MTAFPERLPLGLLHSAGSRDVPWRETEEHSQDVGWHKRPGHCQSIFAMPEYCHKSFEELRWEDYQVCADVPGLIQ